MFHYVLIAKYSQMYIIFNKTKCLYNILIFYIITSLCKHEEAFHIIKSYNHDILLIYFKYILLKCSPLTLRKIIYVNMCCSTILQKHTTTLCFIEFKVGSNTKVILSKH